MKILNRAGWSSASVKADFLHALADFSSTVTALIGVTASFLGYAVGDSVSALILSVFLGLLSVRLVYRTSLELTDISSTDEYQLVQSILENIEGVEGFKGLRMRGVGSKHYVDATVLLSSSIDVEKAHDIMSTVEEKIRRSIGNAVVTIHCEPVNRELPFEQKIKRIALVDERVKGVHKIISTTTDQGTFLTLHVETDPSLTLSKAHEISQRIEGDIKRSFRNIKETTVHLEGYPESDKGQMVCEERDLQKIREILALNPNIKSVSSLRVYLSDKSKHIDITCSFRATDPMHKVHREVSEIEQQIKQSIGECTVTIHPEPF
jgi:divalent metal cation (Fe/Co/Zn/Cd) transporter